MGKGKKFTTFILSTVLLGLLLFFYANDMVTDWLRNAGNGGGNACYYALDAADDGSIWAMGRRNGRYALACGHLDKGDWRRLLKGKQLPEDFLPETLFAVSADRALLSGYCVDDAGIVSKLQLYMISEKGKTVEPLLSKDITAGTEQRSRMECSSFACYNGKVYFLLWDSGNACLYELTPADLNLRMTSSFACERWRAALVLSDGKLAVANERSSVSVYSEYGVRQYDLQVDGCVSALYAGRDSFYYFDTVAQTMNEVGSMDDDYFILQRIPADGSLPMTVQPGGTTLWLENGKLYHYDGAPVEIDGILYRSPRESIALLAGALICVLLLAYCLTLLLRGKRQVSLLTRSSLFMAAVLAIAIGGIRIYVLPASQNSELDKTRENVEIIADFGLQILRGAEDAALPNETVQRVTRSLADSGFYDARVTAYHYAAGGFEVLATNDPDLESGAIVGGNGLLLQAKSYGTVSKVDQSISGPVCKALASDGSYLMYIQADFSSAVEQGSEEVHRLSSYLIAALSLFVCIVFFVLLRVWNGLRRLIMGMDLVSGGDYDVVLSNPTGDELEGLSTSMNHLTGALRDSILRNKRIDENYMRFIPEETIKLLGVDRLENVTRETVANHQMVLMTVRFILPEEEIPTEQLFSDINTMIQRTIFAAVAYGGNSFNFTHDGYNTVFAEEYSEMSFHAALAIKEASDAVNKEREFAGREPVELHVAMSKGLVQMGIVGDELHMVPAAVSLCLKKNERMLLLCQTLKASVLFSETLASEAEGVNYRYVGNYDFHSGKERIYELYDADSYLLAQRKRETQDDFDRALEEFYRGHFTSAKAMLLRLARTGSASDGSVCYYLNKADLYEQNPPKMTALHIHTGED